METTLTATETARIEELLSLLDPDPGLACQVQGCLHAHLTVTTQGGVTALAA